ncbi:hypothetical protein [Celeribacter litoreus]|uniref:hypothetical protein n=1 Tax=Celeribacter litoreus TaxID=2876714 RepID=UPI001CCE349E|nr:hypothetical protein [Celeribacter litoreus]MCA0044183.1 hypothetical protein [Celeribacter litoreus]
MRIAAFWVVCLLTIALYAVMVLWTLSAIAHDAGAPAFDMRPSGYSIAEARAFLSTLSDEGRALYQGPQRWMDAVYPALLAITAIWSSRWAADGRWKWLFRSLAVFACLSMIGDYAENISVAVLLAQPTDAVTDAAIERAAFFTRFKSLFGTFAMTLWLVLLVMRGWRKLTVSRH